jgi:hypothetical protein
MLSYLHQCPLSAPTDINHVLTAPVHDLAMALTAEQHAQLASACDKAAGDCLIPLEQQTAFARKANWYRILARLAEKNKRATGQVTTPPEFLEAKQSRLGAAFKRTLAS